MGRRRRKVVRSSRRTLPSVFACPRCGVVAVRITSQKDDASGDFITTVACGNAACKLRREFRFPTQKPDIDVYATFVDEFAKTSV